MCICHDEVKTWSNITPHHPIVMCCVNRRSCNLTDKGLLFLHYDRAYLLLSLLGISSWNKLLNLSPILFGPNRKEILFEKNALCFFYAYGHLLLCTTPIYEMNALLKIQFQEKLVTNEGLNENINGKTLLNSYSFTTDTTQLIIKNKKVK